ncbi:hypothetical protein Unana1_02005 [Umbelopsis nana]
MSFSLYGDLPKPKSAKGDNAKGPEGTVDVAKAWAAVAPAPTPSNQEPTPAPVDSTKPSGWALYNQFRPVMRKPTVQAKPKIQKPVIPVGGKIVSTVSAQSYAEEKKAVASAVTVQNAMPLKTSVEDVNGFADLPSNAKKAKKIHKNKQKDAQTAMEFDMMEDYDPIRPNDYEMYMEQQNRLKEEEERRRLQRIQPMLRRSISPLSDASSSRSPSPIRHNKMFAPPPPPSDDETTIISKSDQALEMDTSVAAANSGVVSQAVDAVVNPLNLEETAEDAWMRRARLSGKTNITPHQRLSPPSGPDPDVDDSRADNINMGNDEESLRPDATEIILLRNMVGPGQVDDTLQHETADECSKYGKVERCLIFEVPESQVGPNQAVRIFVKFHSAMSAQRAIDDLNGRYFGGRVVTATFFDAKRFERLDLAPTKEEMISYNLSL